ncbi:MAG: hypothetical protein ACLU9S_04665 [Oscillospiraceae bacterium]
MDAGGHQGRCLYESVADEDCALFLGSPSPCCREALGRRWTPGASPFKTVAFVSGSSSAAKSEDIVHRHGLLDAGQLRRSA